MARLRRVELGCLTSDGHLVLSDTLGHEARFSNGEGTPDQGYGEGTWTSCLG
jgi:hypothetical protein